MAVENVKKIIQELVVPDLQVIKGDLRELKVEIRRLDEKIDSLRNEMHSEIRRLDEKIDSIDKKIDFALDIRERLSALESKVLGH